MELGVLHPRTFESHIRATQSRTRKGSSLKKWAMGVAKRAGMRKAKVTLARKLAVVMHRMLVGWHPVRRAEDRNDGITEGEITDSGSREERPLGARSRRQDDGSGQAANNGAAP